MYEKQKCSYDDNSVAALIVVFGSHAYLRRLEADQAQMRTEVNERIQDEEFSQHIRRICGRH